MTVLSELYMHLTNIDAGLLREVEWSQKHTGRPFFYRPRAYTSASLPCLLTQYMGPRLRFIKCKPKVDSLVCRM
jgi:hypothetical protein